MMRVDAATAGDTLDDSQLRSAACTSCACAGVATLPVPIAHTGSYAITTSFHAAAGSALAYAASCADTTDTVVPASRSPSVSPRHAITRRPAATPAAAFSATTALVSHFARRSECPTMAYRTPAEASMEEEISPV